MFVIDKKRIWLPVGAGAAILAGIVVWFFLHHLEGTFQEAGEAVAVLTAGRAISRGTPLEPAFFHIAHVPRAYVEPGALSRFEILESSPGHPRFRSVLPIPEGTQVVQRELVPIAQGEALSQVIPENRVAVSFGVDAIRGLGGNIQPGDLIDVLHTAKGGATDLKPRPTAILFQAVPVIAVGKKWAAPSRLDAGTDKDKEEKVDKGDDDVSVLTILVNPIAAVHFSEARENETLSVVLRAPGDSRVMGTAP